MAIFAVFGSSNPNLLDEAMVEFEDVYKITPGQWLVSETHMTTKEVSAKIDDTGNKGNFIVVPVTNYWGRHPADTWEWIRVRGL